MNYNLKLGFMAPIKKLLLILIVFLPPFLKPISYRILGYKIGRNVKFGWFSGIIAKHAEIGNNSAISHFTLIFANELKMGIHSTISVGCWFYGEGSVIIGNFCYVGARSFINNQEDFIVGNNTGIGIQSIVFTHGIWLPYSEGNPRKFARVKIGNRVWITTRCVLLPGITIGDGALIGANSVIHKDVPKNVFVSGNPFKIISVNSKFIKKLTQDEKNKRIIEMIEHYCVRNKIAKTENGVWEKNNHMIVFNSPSRNYMIKKKKIIMVYSKSPSKISPNISWLDFQSRKCMLKDSFSKDFYNFINTYYGEYFEIVHT